MSYFKKGFDDAQRGKDPSLPTDTHKYDGGNVILDIMCPGLGLAVAAGSPDTTKKDDSEYERGFLAGAIAQKK